MAVQILFRRGTASSWISSNPVLSAGEPGFETDTGKFKIGDGITAWSTLEYATGLDNIINLQDLDNVVITSPTNGQVLKYNGTNWVNGTDTTGGGGGSGTVTSVSVNTANGFSGSIINASTTPSITLSTSVNGILKGNGTSISAAVSGTDFQTPITLTTTGSSGAATLIGNTLNIPQYSGGGGGDGNTTYTISAETSTGGANLRLTGSDSSTDNVKLAEGSNVTIVRTDANTITISSTAGGGGGATNLDGLSDVVLTSPTNGQVLKYNGTAWVNGTDATGGSSIGSLDDVPGVVLTSPTNGEVLKYNGTNWINSPDATGGGSGLTSRSTASGSTSSIANNASENINITGFKSYALLKIQTSAAAWVRLYSDAASRTSDQSRLEGVDPNLGSGVIAEIITTGAQTILITPGTIGFNNESSPTTAIPVRVTNKSGSSTSITVTLTLIQLEA